MALAGGVSGLADATQSRPDPVSGAGTHVVMSVRTRAGLDADLAVASLWAACQPTVRATRLTALTLLGHGRYRLELSPGIGDHGRRRLVGCLEDATIERVLAQVESVRASSDDDPGHPLSTVTSAVEAS
ncbi:MAG: hypothetical protein ACRD2W_05495 [Acidimicrobiales bacterium]